VPRTDPPSLKATPSGGGSTINHQLPTINYRAWLPAILLVLGNDPGLQPVWHAGFIWDDDAYVTENTLLTAPDGLRRIWFSFDSPSQYFR